MVRRAIFVLAATMLVSLAVPALPASAGGGCHDGVTTGAGDTVDLKDLCFFPTTLHVDPGNAVTFVNYDATTHNVTANGWGNFEGMQQGDTFRVTFAEAGIYPYACMYHPGMTGAIVVGNGTGAGNGEAVTVTSYDLPAPSPEAGLAEANPQAPETTGSSAVGWVAGGGIGLGLGVAAGLLLRRRPGSAPPAV